MKFIVLAVARPGVLLVTFNRPEKRNALSVAMMTEIARALSDAEADDDIRCAVMTGDDRAFSAGADIKDQHERGSDAALAPAKLAAWETIRSFSKPLLAAVNGYALGGGHELAMAADIVIAGESAIFGQPEINLGIHPGDGATQSLPRLVGKSLAMRLILSGQFIDAAEARAAGLVAEVVDAAQTVERTLDLAAVIAGKNLSALRRAKDCVLRAYETPLSDPHLIGHVLPDCATKVVYIFDAHDSAIARLADAEDTEPGRARWRPRRTAASAPGDERPPRSRAIDGPGNGGNDRGNERQEFSR